MLDLFAGSGQVGIEAISQGAKHCTFLDLGEDAVATIRKNVAACCFEAQSTIRKGDAYRFIKSEPGSFDLVFVAPPQYKRMWAEIMELIAAYPNIVAPDGRIIVQIDPKEEEELSMESFTLADTRKYGNSLLLFYDRKA